MRAVGDWCGGAWASTAFFGSGLSHGNLGLVDVDFQLALSTLTRMSSLHQGL